MSFKAKKHTPENHPKKSSSFCKNALLIIGLVVLGLVVGITAGYAGAMIATGVFVNHGIVILIAGAIVCFIGAGIAVYLSHE